LSINAQLCAKKTQLRYDLGDVKIFDRTAAEKLDNRSSAGSDALPRLRAAPAASNEHIDICICVYQVDALAPRESAERNCQGGAGEVAKCTPSTTLRVVPLPRRFAAWEEGAAVGLILPHKMGEGDRPKGGGGGGARRSAW
jgi:hypothetical protein